MNFISNVSNLFSATRRSLEEGYFETKENSPKPLVPHLIPQDLIPNIFCYLPPEEVDRASEEFGPESFAPVWERYDLKQFSPRLSIIDEEAWKQCIDTDALGLNFEDSLDVKIRLLEKSLFNPGQFTEDKQARIEALIEKFRKEKTQKRRILISELTQMFECLQIEPIQGVDPGITLLTIPKGLSYDVLMKALNQPRISSNAVPFGFVNPQISGIIGSKTVKKTYQIAITNFFIKGTRNLTCFEQDIFIFRGSYLMPSMTESLALIGLTYLLSVLPSPTTPSHVLPNLFSIDHSRGRIADISNATTNLPGIIEIFNRQVTIGIDPAETQPLSGAMGCRHFL